MKNEEYIIKRIGRGICSEWEDDDWHPPSFGFMALMTHYKALCEILLRFCSLK